MDHLLAYSLYHTHIGDYNSIVIELFRKELNG